MKSEIYKAAACLALSVIILAFMNHDMYASDKNPREIYSKVKINITTPADLMKLQLNDITIEHFHGSIDDGIELTLNQKEVERLSRTELSYQILIADMKKHYDERPAPTFTDLLTARQTAITDNVGGFTYGSMGGYFTYAEVVRKLDSMRLMYPNLISEKKNLGTTIEGRTIWAVKISDNPDADESATEAQVYFDALHHAREPQSMACMMYYMYWLLENHATPEAEYLINNREIFFVPVVNPDGYVYNQTTAPNGGGFWRKNRLNSGGGDYGVDLNRNYNYGWGVNSGSSSDPGSETYRGPSAGSEFETQAIKNFLTQIHPRISFSMHSYAGRYLNPYGYNDTAVDYHIYSEFASDMAAKNNYLYGTVFEMLQYYSSGTTRDYLHSQGTYCWTPEVGGSDFWPTLGEIIPVASENLYGLKYLTWLAGAYADFKNYKLTGKGYVGPNDSLQFTVTVKNRGLSKPADGVTVKVQSLYANITPASQSYTFGSGINSRQSAETVPFHFLTNSSATYMDDIKFIVTVEQQSVVTSTDTFSVPVAKPLVLFSDNAENGLAKWTRAGTGIQWDTTFADPYDGSKNFADSRYGNSRNSSNNTFLLNDTINLIGALNPRIEFAAKWETEGTGDYIRIQVSSNFGSTWTSMPGRFTSTVSGQPSYIRIKHWVNEQINLNSYIGQRIRIRFNLVTNSSVPGDGFYFDNFRVVNYTNPATSIQGSDPGLPETFSLYQNFPNPFNPSTLIKYDLPVNGYVTLKIYDVIGNEVASLIDGNRTAGTYYVSFNAAGLSSGLYYYKLISGNYSEVRKMMLVK